MSFSMLDATAHECYTDGWNSRMIHRFGVRNEQP